MGRPCRAPVVHYRRRCKLHGGLSTGPRTAEGLARLAAASRERARSQARDAVGRFARQNYVSHVTMEHSSIVKFIEWNWLGMETGLLGGRDGVVHNIGSLLDPAMTGTAVPAD